MHFRFCTINFFAVQIRSCQARSVHIRVISLISGISDRVCSVADPPCAMKAASRKTGAPDEPGFGWAGWNFAAQQTVILNERQSRE